MSYTPSIYASTPQIISATGNGAVAIPNAVNVNYTRLTIQGFGQGGFTIDFTPILPRITLDSGSQISVSNLDSSSFTPFINILVEEFLPIFFRQVFYRNTIDITNANQSNNLNTGLSLGPKAYVINLGSSLSYSGSMSAPYTQTVGLSLSGSIVTATRRLGSGSTNTLTTGFMLIDPK